MSDKFENIFKERFSDYEMPPPTGSWGNIAAQIHKPYPFVSVIRIITSGLISAACLFLPITLDKNDFDNNSSWLNYVAINVSKNTSNDSNKNLAGVISFKNNGDSKQVTNRNLKSIHKEESYSDNKVVNKNIIKKTDANLNNVSNVKLNNFRVTNNDLDIATDKNRNINLVILKEKNVHETKNNHNKTIVLIKEEKESSIISLDKSKQKDKLNFVPDVSLGKTNLLKIKKFNGLFNGVGLFGMPKEIIIAEKEKHPFYISAQIRPHLTYGKTVSNTEDEKLITGIKGAKRISKDRMGYSLGIGVEKYFSKKIAISLGVFMDHIKYQTQFDIRNIRPDNIQTLTGPNGMTINTLYEIKQESTLFRYNLYNTRFGIKYIFPNNVTNKYLRFTYGFSKLQKLSYSSKTDKSPVNIDDIGSEINSLIQVSYGIERMINNKIRLNVEPIFSYYLNDLSTNGYHFSLKPYNLGINFGIAYKIR